MKHFVGALVITLLIVGCGKPYDFTEISVNNSYRISLPDFMLPSTDMHPKASLQYENTEKEFYILVIDESKSDMEAYDLDYDIETYYKNLISKPFKDFVTNASISIPARKDINGAIALIADIEGDVNQVKIYYKLAVVETKSKFYQIVVWTRADQRELFEKDMLKVIDSLKEIETTTIPSDSSITN